MTKQASTETLQSKIPERLLGEAQALVDAGWFRSIDEIVLDALRRYLDVHRADLMREFVREDVEWGLHGVD
jgi:Arc/MetJ-type ribon-helix-helix transcriptional regulator